MLASEIDWPAVELAGAFLVGAFLGIVTTLGVMRVVVEYLDRRDRRHP